MAFHRADFLIAASALNGRRESSTIRLKDTHGVLAGEIEGDAVDVLRLIEVSLGQQIRCETEARQGTLER